MTIGEAVDTIGTWAFGWCDALESVNIGNSVQLVDSFAFYNCPALANLDLGNSVETIGTQAFSWCPSLTKITIPNSVTAIGEAAFFKSGLTEIYIPAAVRKIGGAAFGWCQSLKDIDVDAANQNYTATDGILYNKEKTTLLACPGSKTSATIPSTVTKIGENAFQGCHISSIAIPKNVTEIEEYAFNGCNYLQTAYSFNPIPPTLGQMAWPNNSDLSQATLYVPQGSLAAYQGAEGWNVFGRMLELDPTAIDAAEAGGVEISATSGGIAISGAVEGLPVSVYDDGGRLAFSGTATGGTLHIPAAKGHIYIIKVGGKTLKVAM